MRGRGLGLKASILERMMRQSHGTVWTARNLLDLGPREAVDQALHRLARSGAVRRIARGHYQRFSPNASIGEPATDRHANAPAPMQRDPTPTTVDALQPPAGHFAIIAHGIDIVDIPSTQRLLDEPTGQFLKRCFTAGEQAIVAEGRDVAARLSGRFAVKEAVMKALGTGFGAGIGFRDIEVVTLASGAPSIQLHGSAAKRAEALAIATWLVSTSHDGDLAMASVIGLGDQGGPR